MSGDVYTEAPEVLPAVTWVKLQRSQHIDDAQDFVIDHLADRLWWRSFTFKLVKCFLHLFSGVYEFIAWFQVKHSHHARL